MSRDLTSVDISDNPELLRLVEDVQQSDQPCVLRRGGEEVAILLPAKPTKRTTPRRRRGKTLSLDDSLWDLVGSGRSGQGDVSANKHKYLAEAAFRTLSNTASPC